MLKIRRYIITICIIIVTPMLFQCSGSDDLSKDNIPPTITNIVPKDGDTLYLGYNANIFSAELSDDVALANFAISIFSLNSSLGRTDSLYLYYKQGWGDNSFGEKKASAYREFSLGTTQRDTTATNSTVKSYPIIPGDYQFRVICIDMAGNMTTEDRNIKILYLPTTTD